MPTDAELRNLPAHLDDYEFDIHIRFEEEKYALICMKEDCRFSLDGQAAGTQVNGGSDSVFLGYSAARSEVWASLWMRDPDKPDCRCDAPHRALVVMQSLCDRRLVPEIHAVLGSVLWSMGEVKEWHAGIKGNTLEERYAFVYDVLVAEAQGTYPT
jgi:hypothetical protein